MAKERPKNSAAEERNYGPALQRRLTRANIAGRQTTHGRLVIRRSREYSPLREKERMTASQRVHTKQIA